MRLFHFNPHAFVYQLFIAQEERQYAIKSFKSGAKDVMVASGVASKGLDFNDIQHVIIFSMPKEIEDYVHQIGRTGRSGKTGIATTFVNMNTPEQTLLDLKYLLMEAGQKYVAWVDHVRNLADELRNSSIQGSTIFNYDRGSTGGARGILERVSCVWWIGAWYLELPQARRRAAEDDGVSSH